MPNLLFCIVVKESQRCNLLIVSLFCKLLIVIQEERPFLQSIRVPYHTRPSQCGVRAHCTVLGQGSSYTLVVPLLLVISETKDLSHTLPWAVLKAEEHKVRWDTALARALRYGCHTAEHAKSYHRFPVPWVSFIGTSHFKEDGR